MIRKLRRQFIEIAMLSVGIVMAVILIAINAANYVNVNRNLDTRLELIAQNGGVFPDLTDSFRQTDPMDPPPEKPEDMTTEELALMEAEDKPQEILQQNPQEKSAETPEEMLQEESTEKSEGMLREESTEKSEGMLREKSTEKSEGMLPEKSTEQPEEVRENPDEMPQEGQQRKDGEEKKFTVSESMLDQLTRRGISEESQYDTRYFTVTLTVDGEVAASDTGMIAAVSDDEASAYAIKLFEKGKTDGEGYLENYKYLITTATDSDGQTTYLYIFLNAGSELATIRTFLAASVGIGLAGMLVILLLVLFFSRIIVKPMAESYEKQKRFITDASHEIKTPLTIIDANTEILEMMEGENEWTASIRKQIKRLTSLTEKLVFLSRMDEENTRLEMIDFSLSDAVLDVAEGFEAVAEAKGKSLTMEVEEEITYHGDEKTLRQLVSLLLDNAMKYSGENGQIRLTLKTSGKNKILTVWNNVDEIAPGNHDELFDRFYRRESSHNSKTGGFGIGLSVAWAIVQAHKGKISARSEDGRSLFFTIVL